MCLGVPGEVVAIHEGSDIDMGTVAFGPLTKDICLALVPEVEVGHWVVVHAGVAIAVLDEQAAIEAIRLMSEMIDNAP